MNWWQASVKPFIPLVLAFVIVAGYNTLLAAMLSGGPLFVATIALSVVTWYFVCRSLYGTDTGLGTDRP